MQNDCASSRDTVRCLLLIRLMRRRLNQERITLLIYFSMTWDKTYHWNVILLVKSYEQFWNGNTGMYARQNISTWWLSRSKTIRYSLESLDIRRSPARYIPADQRIALLVNDKHAIHHVQEQGYVEAPVRIDSILTEIEGTGLFQRFVPHRFSEKHIKSVHDSKFVNYLKKVCARLEPTESVYPYVFPLRNVARPPTELPIRAGYYCIDTFTPLNRNVYPAAKRAVDCALTAAEKILEGYRLAYALIRPPGHHAEHRAFGGFCYFNSAAIAAEYLSKHGKIALVDIDYHHGNGQQNIFYERSDVLTISIHGNPHFAFPYFSGFKDEKGLGAGKNYNMNIPLPENVDGERYHRALEIAMKRVARFRPDFLVIALGLDTAKSDPTGTWSLEAEDFEANGQMLGSLNLPTLVIQEGGYDSHVLGINARHFFAGLWSGAFKD